MEKLPGKMHLDVRFEGEEGNDVTNMFGDTVQGTEGSGGEGM